MFFLRFTSPLYIQGATAKVFQEPSMSGSCLCLLCICRRLGWAAQPSSVSALSTSSSKEQILIYGCLLSPAVLSGFIPTIGLPLSRQQLATLLLFQLAMTHMSTRLSKEDRLLSRGARADGLPPFPTGCGMPDSLRGPALMWSSGRWREVQEARFWPPSVFVHLMMLLWRDKNRQCKEGRD